MQSASEEVAIFRFNDKTNGMRMTSQCVF